ncbi:MAG: tRNA epoxyqueuosine(34) reductase QueG [bacterium]|jgi:epoxyqueuosine reductase
MLLTKENIKLLAHQFGFDAVGISSTRPISWEKYQDWVKMGYHGEMGYLENRLDARRDADFVLQGVKSILVVAKNYLTVAPAKADAENPVAAVVSRYAWGTDYHTVMGESLKSLCDVIQSRTEGEHKARWCVDTAPLLERDYAAQAGIGWAGKHTNLLSQTLGNWFFLGAVLTTLELEPDQPVKAHCGTCTRCLNSCPTNAFVSPFVLDARRCISYLTIELKDYIPLDLRPLMGQRIFGCDDCLEACPWNRHALPSPSEEFLPRHSLTTANLIDLMQINQETFSRMFKNSPIKRSKRRGFLRNVAVALGNSKDPRAKPVLFKALTDNEELIRAHAAWALGQVGGEDARQQLERAMREEPVERVQLEIQWALDKLI